MTAHPTPSQTVGPFFGYALPVPDGGAVAPAGAPGTVVLHGRVLDGAGAPVPDALVETWQTAPDGSVPDAAGSLRRDQVTDGFLGRDETAFTGFARVATDADGHWALRTLRPGGHPYLAVCVTARGLLHHLFTRAYLDPDATDPLLDSLPPHRAATLRALPGADGRHRFDIRLQGDGTHEETVFLDFG